MAIPDRRHHFHRARLLDQHSNSGRTPILANHAFRCAAGAGFAVAPFYFEYRAEAKAVEIAQLTTVAKEVNKMEEAAKLIAEASANWSSVQETSEQTAKLAEEIASGMAATVKDHDDFMANANTEELSTLKLEVENPPRRGRLGQHAGRRARSGVSPRTIGHRFGQGTIHPDHGPVPGHCREVSRRVGLVAFSEERRAV